jgi:hypothetical protein
MDEVEAAVLVAPTDVLLGDIVAALAHSGAYAFDVGIRIGQTHIPHMNLDALRCALRQ